MHDSECVCMLLSSALSSGYKGRLFGRGRMTPVQSRIPAVQAFGGVSFDTRVSESSVIILRHCEAISARHAFGEAAW